MVGAFLEERRGLGVGRAVRCNERSRRGSRGACISRIARPEPHHSAFTGEESKMNGCDWAQGPRHPRRRLFRIAPRKIEHTSSVQYAVYSLGHVPRTPPLPLFLAQFRSAPAAAATPLRCNTRDAATRRAPSPFRIAPLASFFPRPRSPISVLSIQTRKRL